MNTIRRFLPYLFVFTLPFQLGKHFFPDYAFIDGLRIDYLDPTMYMTDIFAILLIILFKPKLPKIKNFSIIAVTLILVLINIFFSLSPWVSTYKFVKLVEVIWIFYIFSMQKLEPKKVLITLTSIAAIQLVIGLTQLMSGSSIQDVAYLLGERYFTISTPGIAKIVVNGIEFLRPYGTFSHPNALAGFFLALHTGVLFNNDFKSHTMLRNVFLGLSAVIIFASFSKFTIAVLALVYIINAFKTYSTCQLCTIAKTLGIIILAVIFFFASGDPESINKRLLLATHSLKIFLEHPFTGVGLGSYVIAESDFPNPYSYVFIQPVHNIFLLFITEAGLFLSFISGAFLLPVIKKMWTNESIRMLLLVIILTGFFDHYWWTAQQNLLLLPVLFGLLQKGERMVE